LEKLKEQIDIGLAKLYRALRKLEDIGPGQDGRESRAKYAASPNEKEEWVRPNRKKYFKLKNGVGLGNGSMSIKPNLMGLKNT
jgi:hypothetical protein